MISEIAKSASKLWNLNENSILLCARRENYVYKVLDNNNKCYALRIHRRYCENWSTDQTHENGG